MEKYNRLPRHIAIVMDGNGRWATRKRLPRVAGHKAGVRAVSEIVQHARELGIGVLTLFAFSLENRFRPISEVNFLMSLFSRSLDEYIEKLNKNQVCLRIIGDHTQFDPALLAKIGDAERLTQDNIRLQLVIAINYSGRWDILQATRRIAEKVRVGQLVPSSIDDSVIHQHLTLADLPDPDLFIRTSGEQRLSNFMLWQIAYTEMYFSSACWPAFNKEMLDQALEFYANRERRFGLSPEQLVHPIAGSG